VPQAIVDKFAAEMQRVLSDQQVIEAYRRLGLEPAYLPTNEFRNSAVSEIVKWEAVVKASGIQLD
jgi:tripartite-type tricarboxylate transporter receptor subunit TctC